MIIKRYEFGWYKDFGIILINTDSPYEHLKGEKIQCKEYCFIYPYGTDGEVSLSIANFLLTQQIPKLLRYIEKLCVINKDIYPAFIESLHHKGFLKTLSHKEECEILDYDENLLDAKIRIMVDDLKKINKSVLFFRRILWEISEERTEGNCIYTIYGRFAVEII